MFAGFERKVLVALKEINEKVEIVSTNQTKLNLHLIPKEKVLTKPTGMPTLPVKTIRDLENLLKALKDPTNISTLVCSLFLHLCMNFILIVLSFFSIFKLYVYV